MLKTIGRCIYRMRKESMIVLAVMFSGSYGIVHSMYFRRSKDSNDNSDVPSYIYLSSEHVGTTEQIFPFKILQLAKSKNKKSRHAAVRALAEITQLDESRYQMIAQACDLRTTIGLARTFHVPLQYFLPPPFLRLLTKETFESEFRNLFQALSSDDSSQCAQYLTKNANERLQFPTLESDGCVNDGIEEINYGLYYHGKDRLLSLESMKLYLEALLAHSTISRHRHVMAKNGLLKSLHYVRIHYQCDNVKSLIGQILSNMALEDDLHSQIYVTGWLGIMASWMRSPNIQISLPAVKFLANMDRDYENVRFEDGIYLLYPQYREQEKMINADIVFIHGIMGGAFRTWRQHDSMNFEDQKKETENNKERIFLSDNRNHAYTFCWPKDWLAKEIPSTRMIAIDYTSHFSEWKTKCPVDKERRCLKIRAKDTLQKLVTSGIGERPIVWVSHSMGGLIVKQLLVDASNSPDARVNSVAQNTAGVVFYSVPHLGTPVANLKSSYVMLLQPSVEAQLLKKDSPELFKLHEDFKKLVFKQDIKSLSFGETLKSNIGFHWNSVLVPRDSADPSFGSFYELPIDHLNTCKPKTPDSPCYQILKSFLHEIIPENRLISKQVLFGKIPETCIILCLIH